MKVLDFINSLFVLKTKEQAVLIGTIMGLKARSERKSIEKSNPMPDYKQKGEQNDMTDENIDLSKMANDAYCRLGTELEYYKERCRLAENMLIAQSFYGFVTNSRMRTAQEEYNTFVDNVNNPKDLREP